MVEYISISTVDNFSKINVHNLGLGFGEEAVQEPFFFLGKKKGFPKLSVVSLLTPYCWLCVIVLVDNKKLEYSNAHQPHALDHCLVNCSSHCITTADVTFLDEFKRGLFFYFAFILMTDVVVVGICTIHVGIAGYF